MYNKIINNIKYLINFTFLFKKTTCRVMKKLLLLFLSSFFGYSQVYIEVKLVNENIGYAVYNQNISNNAGLNTILAANNVLTYEHKGGDPFENSMKYINIYNGSNDFSNTTLLTQLQNYSSVIESATFCSYAYFNNKLLIQLVTNSTGQQNGTNGNIVVTNDIGLNQIFQQHNIVQMFQAFSAVPNWNSLNRYYYIRSSNCNLQNLKTALQNYATVIQTVDYVSASYLLNNDTFNKNKTLIYPNPFQNELNIKTDKTITTYEVVDISGKMIINSKTKIEFENYISNLKNGLYFLQLNYYDNTNSSHKIIKN